MIEEFTKEKAEQIRKELKDYQNQSVIDQLRRIDPSKITDAISRSQYYVFFAQAKYSQKYNSLFPASESEHLEDLRGIDFLLSQSLENHPDSFRANLLRGHILLESSALLNHLNRFEEAKKTLESSLKYFSKSKELVPTEYKGEIESEIENVKRRLEFFDTNLRYSEEI